MKSVCARKSRRYWNSGIVAASRFGRRSRLSGHGCDIEQGVVRGNGSTIRVADVPEFRGKRLREGILKVDLAAFFRQNLLNTMTSPVDLRRRCLARRTGSHASSPFVGRQTYVLWQWRSAADAQHLATELTIRYKTTRVPIAAIALTMTLRLLPRPATIWALTTSLPVRSGVARRHLYRNLDPEKVPRISALSRRGRGLVTAALGKGGNMAGLADTAGRSLETAARIKIHITLGQMLCGALEIELGLASAPR